MIYICKEGAWRIKQRDLYVEIGYFGCNQVDCDYFVQCWSFFGHFFSLYIDLVMQQFVPLAYFLWREKIKNSIYILDEIEIHIYLRPEMLYFSLIFTLLNGVWTIPECSGVNITIGFFVINLIRKRIPAYSSRANDIWKL